MPLLSCYKCTTLGPSSAVKHKWARLNLQSVCHNSHLSHCRSSGETCKNKHIHHKRDKRQEKVAFVCSELWNRTRSAFCPCKNIFCHLTFHKACSLLHVNPMVTWTHMDLDHLQILSTLGCALKSREGILCGTLPLISGISSASPNESACFYLCSALLTLFLKRPMPGRQSW